MKQDKHTICSAPQPTSADVCRWAQALSDLHQRLAPRFARPEPRRRALLYLQAILSDIPRKNGWQVAEQAREATPYGMQRLLSQAAWDTDGVRDDVRSYVLEQLGSEWATLIVDETSFCKRGKHSAGVGLQYCGTTGQIENCQVGVFLSYASARGHALIDRELYLPLDWCEDRDRCRAAGIPDTVRFRTKPELARTMIERICAAQIPIGWVVADSVYGGNLDLRTWLEAHHYSYVMGVACDEPVGIHTPDGVRRRVEASAVEAYLLRTQDWQRLSMSQGTKGPRLFDWAVVPILHRWEDDGRHWLLIRRCVNDPSIKAFYLVFGPPHTELAVMVKVCGTRWHIEEDFANTKELGLDHYEVRGWTAWYRCMTLVLLAYAFLVGMCTQMPTPSRHLPLEAPGLLFPLTVAEVQHLLARLIWPSSASVRLVLAWSQFRRRHYGYASYFHSKRRLKAG
jgi:SRSO17 transposase